jgi:hypothetical protein
VHVIKGDNKHINESMIIPLNKSPANSANTNFLNALVLLQCISFAILNAIWVLPNTIALRYVCLVMGAILSLYPIFLSRKLLFRRQAITVWLLIGLFTWATFHLLFLSQNPELQYKEFASIWKSAAIGFIFALGLGLSIARLSSLKADRTWNLACWIIFYVGLFSPTFIYLAKAFTTIYGQKLGISIPVMLQPYLGPNPIYVAKTAYVAFCIPVLAAALGAFLFNLKNQRFFAIGNLFYSITIPAVFLVFFLENIKNGFIYGAILIFLFFIFLFANQFKGRWFLKLGISVCLLFIMFIVVSKHVQQNPSWQTFVMDAKIAWQTDNYSQWKYNGAQGYPNNEMGTQVSITNYERIAWAREGVSLIGANLLGYGLVERSFGHLSKIRWPDSALHQSHSGWIDLTLGIGIPGLALILGALVIATRQLIGRNLKSESNQRTLWKQALGWILLGNTLMWCTTEISQKTYFEAMIFWIAMAAGITLYKTQSSAEKLSFSRLQNGLGLMK